MKKGVAVVSTLLLLSLAGPAFAGGDTPQAVRIPNDLHYWEKSSFAEMVPPLREPTDKDHLESIRVWVKIPEDQKITVSWIAPQNRYSLMYPNGTVADRVDSSKNDPASDENVDDVRGARIDEKSDTVFHDYEVAPDQSASWLMGYEWKRDGDQADLQAADALVALFFPPGFHWDPGAIQHFRQLNRCAACHQPDAPAPVTTAPPFRFESDSRGFFQPMTILQNSMTVRDHRDWDLNADDPFITVWCGDQQTHAVTQGDVRKYVCANDIAPVGKLDIRAALQNHDPHAQQVCQSRSYLFRHMDLKARQAFSTAFEDCGISDKLVR